MKFYITDWVATPDPYTDANEAVKLLEELGCLNWDCIIGFVNGVWDCEIYNVSERFLVKSESLNEAISDCFLKVKGGKK